MPAPDDITAALEKQELKNLVAKQGEQLAAMAAVVAQLKADRDNALKYAVIVLISAVVGMGVWIFNLATGGHIK